MKNLRIKAINCLSKNIVQCSNEYLCFFDYLLYDFLLYNTVDWTGQEEQESLAPRLTEFPSSSFGCECVWWLEWQVRPLIRLLARSAITHKFVKLSTTTTLSVTFCDAQTNSFHTPYEIGNSLSHCLHGLFHLWMVFFFRFF